MSKKEYLEYKKSYLLVPLSISFLLVIGIIVSLVQLKQQQTFQSKASAPTAAVASVDCSVPQSELSILNEEQALFDQINSYRKQHGRAPLAWSPQLTKAAAWMSNDMMTHATLSHTDSRGRTTETRLAQCDQPFPATVGENIDSGTTDASSLITAWSHSTKQNANLLNHAYTHIGIALVKGTDASKIYWTADFAGPAPTATPTQIPTAKPIVTAKPPTPTLIAKVSPTSKLSSAPNPSITTPKIPTIPPSPTVTPIPTIDPDFKQNLNDTQIFVSVAYIGVGKSGNKTPKNLARKVQADIYDLENNIVKKGQGFLQFDTTAFRGIIHLGKIPNGKYYVKITSENSLTAVVLPQFQELSNKRLNVLPEVLITQGDLDADNLISITDYNLALLCFQDKKCQDVKLIDFNDDGKADISDYNILLGNYLLTYGD